MLKEFNQNTRALWRNQEWRTFIIFTYPLTLLGYLIQKGFEALFGRFYLKH
ncbi:MAG TPA: hypothetical protein VMW64_08200 [Dehalococcoidia bacterium]|nr:hypothetical protein [Dehalococcoidia bacterium]